MRQLKCAISSVLLFAACVSFVGCAAPATPPQPPAPAVVESTGTPIAQEMVGTRFSSSPKPPGANDPEGVKFSYKIGAGEVFTGYYEIDNVRNDAHSYRLMAFVDYEQVPIVVDGKKALSHTLKVDAAQKAWWPIEVGPFSEGAHTFTTVLMWDSEYHSLDKAFRFATEAGFMSTNQSTLVVGTAGSSKRPASLKATSTARLLANQQYDGIRINRSSGTIAEWLSHNAAPGETIDFYIHVGNTQKRAASYSLIALLDGEQIGISGSSGPTVITVPAGSMSVYKTSVRVPTEPGVHELQVVKGVAPFTRITGDIGQMMESSIRVPITVK